MLLQSTRQKFSDRQEDYKRESYQRLGKWYLDQEDYINSYHTFYKINDYENLLITLEKDKAKSLNAYHSQMFFDWMSTCPQELLIDHPEAIVIGMITMFSMNNIPEIFRLKAILLDALEKDKDLSLEERNNLLGDAEVAESFLAYNNISAMSQYHRKAVSLLTRPSVCVDLRDAWTFSAPSVFMMYHRTVGGADNEKDEMKDCMPYYYQITDGHGSGSEYSFAADLFYERGNFIDAEINNRIGLGAAKGKDQYSIMLSCNFLSMRRALLEGDFDEINKIGLATRKILYEEQQYMLLNTLDMCLGFIYSLMGKPDLGPKWMVDGRIEEALVMFPATPMLHTFYNQLLLAMGDWTQVLARKEECENLNNLFDNTLPSIWLHIQVSAALLEINRKEEARKELNLALDMAMPDMIIMPFVESEYYIFDLLKELGNEGIYERQIAEIIELSEKFSSSRRKILKDNFKEYDDLGLSDRELEIAILAAKRKTNGEIAKELHLAEGTVRNHLSRIFDKLAIEDRGKNKRLELERLLKM